MKNDRFVVIEKQGMLEGAQVIIDRETGVNYLFYFAGYAGGLTPLLGSDGKPIVTQYGDSY
jgi:hypothetical protein